MCVCSFRLYITFDFCYFLSCFFNLLFFFVKSLIKYYGSLFSVLFLHYFVGIELQDFRFITFLCVTGLVVWFCIEKISVQEKYQFRSFIRSYLYCLVTVAASDIFSCFGQVNLRLWNEYKYYTKRFLPLKNGHSVGCLFYCNRF